MLNAWFVGQVELRKLSPEERAELAAMLPYPFDVPEYDLAEQTYAAAHDIGIYFAEVFRHQYPFMLLIMAGLCSRGLVGHRLTQLL